VINNGGFAKIIIAFEFEFQHSKYAKIKLMCSSKRLRICEDYHLIAFELDLTCNGTNESNSAKFFIVPIHSLRPIFVNSSKFSGALPRRVSTIFYLFLIVRNVPGRRYP
jgi:hypothetical protein